MIFINDQNVIGDWSNLFRQEKSNSDVSSELLVGGIECIRCSSKFHPDCGTLNKPLDLIQECPTHPNQNGCLTIEYSKLTL